MNQILILVAFLIINISTADGLSKVDRPVIGIVTEHMTDKYILKAFNQTRGKTFIAASYVKFLQSAGARVLPIYGTMNDKNLTFIFNSINGILLPGGGVNLVDSSPYYKMGKRLFNMALLENKKGNYFPMFGICLGFESLLSFVEGSSSFLENFDSENISLPVTLYPDFRSSRMFKLLPKSLEDALQKHKLTSDFHAKGVSPHKYWKSRQLSNFFRILGTSQGRDKKTFIAAIESRKYPFYGLQFHPEKPAFEWHPTLDINHSGEAIKIGQYFANFFVDEARKNNNKFKHYDEELDWMIDKFSPIYAAFNSKSKSPYDQVYVF